MIYRLRRRFIAIAFFSMLFVLLGITALINVANYSAIVRSADDTLALIADNNGYFPRPPKSHGVDGREPRKNMRPEPELPKGGKFDQSPEAPFATRYFSVTLDANGGTLSVNTGSIAAITTKEAAEMASQIAISEHDAGFHGIYRYVVDSKDDRTQIVFLDCRKELGTVIDFLLISLGVDIAGLAAVLILIWIFSRAAVRPVAESYEKQKQFITDAGHELKTPLAIISANVDVLELDTGDNQWTGSIRNQIARMTKLTAHLTLLASMEEAEHKLSMSSVDISTLVENSVEEMVYLAETHGKTFSAKITRDIVTQGDIELLQQLMTILLDNAIKHSVPDTEISVTLAAHAKGGILTLSNAVEGFSAGKQDQIFERFYRADTSRSSETGGHGLGLSIAKAIVGVHKLRIYADCIDGKIFTIIIKYF